ncbi:unnamed protein product [Brassica oleracea var. botrytis]
MLLSTPPPLSPLSPSRLSLSSSPYILCKNVDSLDLLVTTSPLRFQHTTPSQASTVLHRVGSMILSALSSSPELTCKSVDAPDFLATMSPLRLYHITPSQTSTSTMRPSDQSCYTDPTIPKLFVSYPMFAHTRSGLDPTKPSALSPNFILSASLEVKLELEIHLVSSVSLVGFKADYACFHAKSSRIGLRTLSVVYSSGASHLKFLLFNIPTSSNRCFNVVFDYQLFLRTIAMGTKVELPFGFFHFAEHDSPRNGFIFSCFVMFSSFVLPSSMAPRSSASVVNIDAH